MEDNGEDLTPFWLQKTTDFRRTDRLRQRLSSIINSALLLIILLGTAVFFLAFILPASLSSTSSIFKASSMKKSWDSINVVLVLVAVIFGFLSKNKNEDANVNSPGNGNEVRKSEFNPVTPRTWYDNVDRSSFGGGGGGLRRTFSSYPDLSEVSPRWISAEDHWRFYDDTHIETYRVSNPDQIHRRRSWRDIDRTPERGDVKTIYEYPFVSKNVPTFSPPAAPPSPTPAPAPVPAPINEEKVTRPAHSIGRKKERTSKKRGNHQLLEDTNSEVVMTPATLPSPPPPPPMPQYVQPRISKSDWKRSGTTSATKEFLNSFYHKKKRKNRSKSVDNFDALLRKSEPLSLHNQWPPPPPPPPPPPSLFQNLFTSKKGRRKRNATVTSPPPSRISRRNDQIAPTITRTSAPKPVKVLSFNSEENSNSGGESPLMSIPPPPPPPPPAFFRKHAWKFVVQGDYVRIDSTLSSRSGSPEPEDLGSAESTPTATSEDIIGGNRTAFTPSPLFCPSPDVNTKAENFISNFRAGLKLEKINSIKKQEGLGLSNLGPKVGPN